MRFATIKVNGTEQAGIVLKNGSASCIDGS